MQVASRSQGTNFETKIFNYRCFLALPTETSFTTPHYYPKQDKVNTADSAFIFFDNSKSIMKKVKAKKMVLCGLVFARKIARMILIQNM